MSRYTLGVDIGTTSICALALDCDSGKTLHALNRANTSSIASEDSFARMQNTDVILETAYALIAELEEKLGPPAAIGVTGQMHGIVYLDADGNAVSPLYTWQDARGAQEKENGETYVEYMRRITGYPVSAGYGLATHFYQHCNGAVPANAVKLCTVHDFLAMKLANRTSPVVHASDAASLGLYDLKNDCFDLSAMGALGMSASILPEVTTGSESIGYYKENIPVYPAIGDNQASFLGSAGEEEGNLLVNIGTGSQVSVIGKLGDTVAGIECRPFLNGKHLLVGSSLCGGRAYAILEKFFRAVANMCGADIQSAYPFMDKWIAENTPEQSLNVSTLFDGTREDPTIRGSISGISITNLEPGAMMDGFMRGIAQELHALYQNMSGLLDTEVKTMIGSGNGLRVNPALCKVMEHTFGMALTLSDSKEEAALGAAKFANR
ncbi:MAG: hypothetical protein IJW55_01715 [Clostridia bacterium]|nr:hypothetical protein [Clostridia bacterium]